MENGVEFGFGGKESGLNFLGTFYVIICSESAIRACLRNATAVLRAPLAWDRFVHPVAQGNGIEVESILAKVRTEAELGVSILADTISEDSALVDLWACKTHPILSVVIHNVEERIARRCQKELQGRAGEVVTASLAPLSSTVPTLVTCVLTDSLPHGQHRKLTYSPIDLTKLPTLVLIVPLPLHTFSPKKGRELEETLSEVVCSLFVDELPVFRLLYLAKNDLNLEELVGGQSWGSQDTMGKVAGFLSRNGFRVGTEPHNLHPLHPHFVIFAWDGRTMELCHKVLQDALERRIDPETSEQVRFNPRSMHDVVEVPRSDELSRARRLTRLMFEMGLSQNVASLLESVLPHVFVSDSDMTIVDALREVIDEEELKEEEVLDDGLELHTRWKEMKSGMLVHASATDVAVETLEELMHHALVKPFCGVGERVDLKSSGKKCFFDPRPGGYIYLSKEEEEAMFVKGWEARHDIQSHCKRLPLPPDKPLMLFHGTTLKNAHRILHQGLKCKAGGWKSFGPGHYATDSFTAACIAGRAKCKQSGAKMLAVLVYAIDYEEDKALDPDTFMKFSVEKEVELIKWTQTMAAFNIGAFDGKHDDSLDPEMDIPEAKAANIIAPIVKHPRESLDHWIKVGDIIPREYVFRYQHLDALLNTLHTVIILPVPHTTEPQHGDESGIGPEPGAAGGGGGGEGMVT